MARVDAMYQFSLHWFVDLFLVSRSRAAVDQDIKVRTSNLNQTFTELLFQSVSRSLFAAHKTVFLFLVAVRIVEAAGKVNPLHWRFLVAGAAPTKRRRNPAPSLYSMEVWQSLVALSELPAFSDIDKYVGDHQADFRAFMEDPYPNLPELPKSFSQTLTMFDKLLLYKCLRPDKLLFAIRRYVTQTLGKQFNELLLLDLEEAVATSSNVVPLVFILSRGVDPFARLQEFAKQRIYNSGKKLLSISLGQGQGKLAEALIAEGMAVGHWVLLQNCHLAVSWLKKLEDICYSMTPESSNHEFRLWLTSEPTPAFPTSILQRSVKLIDEAPTGIKAHLTQTYLNFSDAFLESSSKPQQCKKLMFSLALFHAVIVDRNKFGSLGWNTPYRFTGALSYQILSCMLLSRGEQVHHSL
jgi:dynein heavy chain